MRVAAQRLPKVTTKAEPNHTTEPVGTHEVAGGLRGGGLRNRCRRKGAPGGLSVWCALSARSKESTGLDFPIPQALLFKPQYP